MLTVSTNRGEYVLDNLTSSILPPSQTGHAFYSRQSGRGWISASGERTAEPTADFPLPIEHIWQKSAHVVRAASTFREFIISSLANLLCDVGTRSR